MGVATDSVHIREMEQLLKDGCWDGYPEVEPYTDEPGGFVQLQRGHATYGAIPYKLGDKLTATLFENSEGSVFDGHQHHEKEWLIVIEGVMVLTFKNGAKKVRAGQEAIIPPGKWHKATFPERTLYLAITHPATSDF